MAGVTDSRPATGLEILNALPDGILDCGARDLHLLLSGPTLIELEGRSAPPLFVSILQHGNEDSGLGAVQRVLRDYHRRPIPRSLMLLIGNVDAARFGLRRLDNQPDYNRVWPGTLAHGDAAEGRIMAAIHARVIERRAFAAIDLHNNTGRNPHYGVVCNLHPSTLGLAALFSRRVVVFRGIRGTQTASLAGLIPAMTAECGRPGEAANAEAAADLIEAVLNLGELPELSSSDGGIELFHTLGVVRVRKDVSFCFGPGDCELRLDPALDDKNFRELKPGTVLGETSHPMPLEMIDEAGNDVAASYFESGEGRLRLRQTAVPAMFTLDPLIVRQDCLCYLMTRL